MDTPYDVTWEEWCALLDYAPRRGQKAMVKAIDEGYKFVSMFAFPRAGKSYGAGHYISWKLLQPDYHIWIVAPTYPLGSKEFFYAWADLGKAGVLDLATKKASDIRGNMYIEMPWGAFLRVVSADNPSSLRAEELDLVILAEASALNEKVYLHHLYARTQKRGGVTVVPTTPMGKNWCYDFFRVPSRQLDPNGLVNDHYDPKFWSVVVSADPQLVHPHDWDMADLYEPGVHDLDVVEDARRRLPTPIFLEQFGGGFASYAGAVFPFDPDVHQCEPFDIPDDWTHIVGWDHGSSSPSAIMVGSYGPDGTIYWWGEIHTAGLTTREYYGQLRALLDKKAPAVISTDPSAKQVRIELQAIDVFSDMPHDKQIMSGVIRITAQMRERKFKVFKDHCPNFVRELYRMEWDEKNPKKILNDADFHCTAAVRYASLITVPLPPEDATQPVPKTALQMQTEALWRPWNKKMAVKEARNEWEDLDDILNPDILGDSSLPLPYVPGQDAVTDYDPFDW